MLWIDKNTVIKAMKVSLFPLKIDVEKSYKDKISTKSYGKYQEHLLKSKPEANDIVRMSTVLRDN